LLRPLPMASRDAYAKEKLETTKIVGFKAGLTSQAGLKTGNEFPFIVTMMPFNVSKGFDLF
jgi:hypothetical protein